MNMFIRTSYPSSEVLRKNSFADKDMLHVIQEDNDESLTKVSELQS